MSVHRSVDELAGRTVSTAVISPRVNGDAEFVITFTDGSVAIVSAWKHGSQTLQMNVDLSPNDRPTHGGEAHRAI